jgi:ferric-dicitrate binding protein FerR (iron transport regulator)
MVNARRTQTAKLSLLLAVTLRVCVAQPLVPEDPRNFAKAEKLSGTVSVLKDNVPWTLSEGGTVKRGDLVMTGPDGRVVFRVSDGSTIEVYPNSQFVFRNNPGNWQDLLDMIIGRVHVEIQHLLGQPNPNRIFTPTAVISVRGTSFDISVDEGGDVTQVDVTEGVVEVQHALLPRDNPAVLKAGETIRVYKNEPIARNLLDKGTVLRQVLRAMADAMSTMATRSNGHISIPGGGPIGTPGPGGTSPGDTCKAGTPGCGGTGPPITGPGSLPPPPSAGPGLP